MFKIKIAPAAVAFRAIGQVFEGQKKVIAISGVLYQANILVNIQGLRLSVYFKFEGAKLHIIAFLAAVGHHDEGFGVWSFFKFCQKTPGVIGRKKVEERRIGSRQGRAGFAEKMRLVFGAVLGDGCIEPCCLGKGAKGNGKLKC